MTTSRFLRPLIAFLVIATAGSAFAQEWKGRGRIHGTIKDAGGAPVEGARIVLAFGDGGEGPTATSDKKGNWALGGLRGGIWNLDVEKAGFTTRKLSVQVQEFGPGPQVEVTLEKSAGAMAMAAEDKRAAELKDMLKAGDDHFRAGRFAEARAEYEKVFAERPDILEIERSIAYCWYREGKLGEAAEALKTVVEKDPGKPETVVLLANILLEKGELDEGLRYLSRVDDSAVTDPGTFLNVGVLLYNKQKTQDAARYFTKVIERDASYAEAYYYRGLARLQLDQQAAARADFARFLELKPDAPEAPSVKEILRSLG